MEKDIIFRKINKNDYEDIKKLIGEAFGIKKFFKDFKILDTVLNVYLHGCIVESSFSEVAIKDKKVIGIILGNCLTEKKIKTNYNTLSLYFNMWKLAFVNKENKKLLKEFSEIERAYSNLMGKKIENFQGAIQLFIVSEEFRGFGTGKKLINSLYDYMRYKEVRNLYLYTDNTCNYKFYERENFNRIGSKEVDFYSVKSKIDMFLYTYEFTE